MSMESTPTTERGNDGARARQFATAFGIFTFAFAIRMVFLAQLESDPLREDIAFNWKAWGVYDSAFYHEMGSRVSQGSFLFPTAYFLSPLYYYFIGAVYALFGIDLEWIRIAQAVLGAGSCTLLYWIGRNIFSETAGILSGLALSVYGLHIYYTGSILATVCVVFLNLLFVHLIVGARGMPSVGRAVASGLVLGLAVATKPNAILLLPVLLAVYGLVWRKKTRNPLLASAAALLAGTILTVAPFTLHNYLATGEFVLVSTNGGRNLMKGNGPGATGSHIRLPVHLRGRDLDAYLEWRVDPHEAIAESSQLGKEAWQHMASQPLASLGLLVKKSLLFVNHRELFIRDNFYFAKRYSPVLALPLASFGLIGVLGLTGAIMGWRTWRSSLLLYGMLLVQLASYTLIFVLARYRLVAACCLILFASHLIVDVVRRLRARDTRFLITTACALLASTAIVNLNFSEFPYDRGFDQQKITIMLREKLPAFSDPK
jgi:4-amino-4-deoxy-L-arabinose transferase-like glycosyltransferase